MTDAGLDREEIGVAEWTTESNCAFASGVETAERTQHGSSDIVLTQFPLHACVPDGVIRLPKVDETSEGEFVAQSPELDELGESEELLGTASTGSKATLLGCNDAVSLTPRHQSMLQHSGVDFADDGEQSDRTVVCREFTISVLMQRYDDSSQPVHRHFALLPRDLADAMQHLRHHLAAILQKLRCHSVSTSGLIITESSDAGLNFSECERWIESFSSDALIWCQLFFLCFDGLFESDL